VAENTASALFGMEGLRVFDADVEADGTVTVWALTDHPGAASCPDCGAVSGRVHEYVLSRPRDLRRGLDEIMVAWCKRRWKCVTQECARKTFTESLPAIPPRCRLTSRLRDLLATEVAERGCTVAEAGRWQHVSWPVTQKTGEYLLLADRWHTCFFDLPGGQGLLRQVEGRTADDAAYWLAQATPAWRDAVEVVAIDMCSIYASAVRRMLPAARLVGGLVPRGAARGEGDRGRAPPRGPGEIRAARPVRRPGVQGQEPAGAQPGAPVTGPVRQGHGHPRR